MRPTILRVTGAGLSVLNVGDCMRVTASGETYYVSGYKPMRGEPSVLRVWKYRPSPLPRRLP